MILPKGGKGVNALDQRVLFRNLRKAAGAPHHKAHVRPFRFCQALLDGLKQRVKVAGVRRFQHAAPLHQPHRGALLGQEGDKAEAGEAQGQQPVNLHQHIQGIGNGALPHFAQDQDYRRAGLQPRKAVGEPVGHVRPGAAAPQHAFQGRALQKRLHALHLPARFLLLQLRPGFLLAQADLLVHLLQHHLVSLHFQQVAAIEGRLGGAVDVLEVVKAAEKDEVRPGPEALRLLHQGQAVQVRHADVGENHVHLVFPEDGQGVRPGIGPEHNGPVPVILLQLGGKPLHNVGLVIHNQDGLHAVSSFRSRRSTSVAQKPPRLPRETVRSPPRSFMRPLTFFSAVTFSPMFSSSR